jgi:hypothetical protein
MIAECAPHSITALFADIKGSIELMEDTVLYVQLHHL